MWLPESERPGYEQQPLLNLDSYRDVPEELIEAQPEWRRVHMRSVRVYNRYYEAPQNICIFLQFDPRPVRRGEWRPYHVDLL